jgi:hypothetical protein
MSAIRKFWTEVVLVGTDTPLEDQKVSVFVTAPGQRRKGIFAKIGPPIRTAQTGQGNVHLVVLEGCKKRFPSLPKDRDISGYVLEAFFDQALGGDFFTSTKKPIRVVP